MQTLRAEVYRDGFKVEVSLSDLYIKTEANQILLRVDITMGDAKMHFQTHESAKLSTMEAEELKAYVYKLIVTLLEKGVFPTLEID